MEDTYASRIIRKYTENVYKVVIVYVDENLEKQSIECDPKELKNLIEGLVKK